MLIRIRRTIVVGSLCAIWAFPLIAQETFAISHASVVDVVNGGIERGRTLIIENGRIRDIQGTGKPIPPGAKVVDASGKFVIPGLWDMHYHFDGGKPGVRELNLLVANGVLGIRDMGDRPEEIFPARNAVASGKKLGPDIVACGPIVDGPNPTNPPLSVSVSGAADARAMVRRLKEMGADCLKVHDGVPLDAYLALADESKRIHLPLVGHVPVAVRVMQATNAGQRSIEHQIGLRSASTVEDELMASEKANDVFGEAMRTKNFQLIPESIARKGNYTLDHFSETRARELYGAFVRNRTYLDPTLVTDRALSFVDDFVKLDDPRLKYIPAAQREWWNPERGMLTRYRTPAYIEFRKRQYEATLRQIPVASRAGVQFLAGTDSTLPFVYPGFSVHDELGLFVQAGLSPLAALQTATINPARLLGRENSTGAVQTGKIANLVLLDADPLQDIANTKKIHAVVLRGKLLSRTDLDGLLKVAEAMAQQ
jgi:hypothetical protein